jgi:hypothetical protein
MTEKLFDTIFSSILLTAQAVWLYLLKVFVLKIWNVVAKCIIVG